jgi:hypothetical protein
MLISCNPCGGNFSNFFHMFEGQHTTRSCNYMCQKQFFFFSKMVLVLKMAVLEHFWWKHSLGTLGIKPSYILSIYMIKKSNLIENNHGCQENSLGFGDSRSPFWLPTWYNKNVESLILIDTMINCWFYWF